jgi:hypothetical protein
MIVKAADVMQPGNTVCVLHPTPQTKMAAVAMAAMQMIKILRMIAVMCLLSIKV